MLLPMSAWPFALAAALATAAAVWGKAPGRMAVHWVAKPGAMGFVLAIAMFAPSQLNATAHAWLLVALGLSLLGDVFLMFKRRLFLAGLVSFLLAHLAYMVALSFDLPWQPSQLGYLVPPLLAAAASAPGLWPHLGKLRPAVITYMVALALVAFRLLARASDAERLGLSAVIFSAAGAVLFVSADTLLAFRYFAKKRVPYTIELPAYVTAQLCIVLSTLRWG